MQSQTCWRTLQGFVAALSSAEHCMQIFRAFDVGGCARLCFHSTEHLLQRPESFDEHTCNEMPSCMDAIERSCNSAGLGGTSVLQNED